MRLKQKVYSGFTLIEMMVVIAIIGIMSTVALVSLTNARLARDLDRAAREVSAALREAQNAALTGKSTNVNENNCQFSVQFGVGTSGYSVRNTYRDASGNCTLSGTLSTYTLQSGVTFTGTPTVAFTLPRGEVTPSGALRIGLNKSGSTQYVCVYPGGQIQENGTNATCP